MGTSQGFESLSMRPLARELGVSAMAIYHHVGNKNDLLALLVDAVLSRIEIPAADSGSWQDRLRSLNGRSSVVVASYPGIDTVIFGMRPTEEGWRLINAYIEILLDAGFNERDAALGFSVIHSHGLGRSGMERGLSRARHEREMPPQNWPALARLQPYWADLHKPDYRDFAMDAVIAGLESVLESAEYHSGDKDKTKSADSAALTKARRNGPQKAARPTRVGRGTS